jgi:NAD(P)-dependent dehydrogenase (short-subunit alcohol dehydrogenase family)
MSSKAWFVTGSSKGFGHEWALAALERGVLSDHEQVHADVDAGRASRHASPGDPVATHGAEGLPVAAPGAKG